MLTALSVHALSLLTVVSSLSWGVVVARTRLVP
jgi:hypothetical protein